MRTNKTAINLIKHFEGLHDGDLKLIGLQPKMCPAGIWTEGYGRAMRDSKGKFIRGAENKKLAYSRITIKTEPQAEKALAQDLKVYENIVMIKIKTGLTENEFSALVSYTYNTGGSSTLFKLVNAGAPAKEIQNWFKTKYITANGVIYKGLILRRAAESSLFFLAQ
jgi:lysozyme